MAKAKFQPWMKGLSGTMGDVVFRQTKNGDTIISSRPDMKKLSGVLLSWHNGNASKRQQHMPKRHWQILTCTPFMKRWQPKTK